MALASTSNSASPPGVRAARRWLLNRLLPGWQEQRCARSALAQAVRWMLLLHRADRHCGDRVDGCPVCELADYALGVDASTAVLR